MLYLNKLSGIVSKEVQLKKTVWKAVPESIVLYLNMSTGSVVSPLEEKALLKTSDVSNVLYLNKSSGSVLRAEQLAKTDTNALVVKDTLYLNRSAGTVSSFWQL